MISVRSLDLKIFKLILVVKWINKHIMDGKLDEEVIWDSSNVDNFKNIDCFNDKKELNCKIVWENEPQVKTISPFWLHISTLRDEYLYNEDYTYCIKELSTQFVGWKRVRGDGNCYYRSVVSSFLLKIFNINKNSNRIFEFITSLRSIKQKVSQEHKSEFR